MTAVAEVQSADDEVTVTLRICPAGERILPLRWRLVEILSYVGIDKLRAIGRPHQIEVRAHPHRECRRRVWRVRVIRGRRAIHVIIAVADHRAPIDDIRPGRLRHVDAVGDIADRRRQAFLARYKIDRSYFIGIGRRQSRRREARIWVRRRGHCDRRRSGLVCSEGGRNEGPVERPMRLSS